MSASVDDPGDGEIAYDYLIVASGATHAYFGHDEWRSRARAQDARGCARDPPADPLAFEDAERECDGRAAPALLTFVVIGGGPTGVELAGALAEIARHSLARDFR